MCANGAFLVDVVRGENVQRYIAESVAEIIPLLRSRKRELSYLKLERVEGLRGAGGQHPAKAGR